MPKKQNISQEDFLKNPEARNVTQNITAAMTERREYLPPKCEVFSHAYTKAKEEKDCIFHIHREAKKQLPNIIHNQLQKIEGTDLVEDSFKQYFVKKRNIGVVFSGGPSPGGHNVIAGIFDAAKKVNPDNQIFGFLLGPDGILNNQAIEITSSLVDEYRNTGGFGMIKTGRTKIDTSEKISLCKNTCKNLNLDALVIVGGDDSNTNAAFLAQEMFNDKIQVLGVPKTIDGDVQVRDSSNNILCAMSFGFHTAARAFAQEISNLCTDCSSDIKYWHICRVMGRSASHLALEVALQTHANLTLIGEDLADYTDKERLKEANSQGKIDFNAFGMTLRHLSRIICDCIVRRSAMGKNYGLLVIPEGVLEFINEIQAFIIKLNTIIAEYNLIHDKNFHQSFPMLEDKLEYLRRLARNIYKENEILLWNERDDELFNDLPAFFQEGLLSERDNHGNFQFSLVETDKILMELVKDYLHILKEKGIYKIGIERAYYKKSLMEAGLDQDIYGPVLFKNYNDNDADFLLTHSDIISRKTLKLKLVQSKLMGKDDVIPETIERIYNQSVPKFKTQTHFYGYDGRGSNPTGFDCRYAYNLGFTAFSLIANGATGQMAAIKNLEKDFSQWEPIGIPIAPLMHLEERKGKLALVLEKSLVDVQSPAFKTVKAFREKWLAATPGPDNYRTPGPIQVKGKSEEDRPLTLMLNNLGSTT